MTQPDPALQKLKPLVGAWKLSGHLTGSKEENIKGETSFRWVPGGFFLQQDINLDFMGKHIISREIIGCDPGSNSPWRTAG